MPLPGPPVDQLVAELRKAQEQVAGLLQQVVDLKAQLRATSKPKAASQRPADPVASAKATAREGSQQERLQGLTARRTAEVAKKAQAAAARAAAAAAAARAAAEVGEARAAEAAAAAKVAAANKAAARAESDRVRAARSAQRAAEAQEEADRASVREVDMPDVVAMGTAAAEVSSAPTAATPLAALAVAPAASATQAIVPLPALAPDEWGSVMVMGSAGTPSRTAGRAPHVMTTRSARAGQPPVAPQPSGPRNYMAAVTQGGPDRWGPAPKERAWRSARADSAPSTGLLLLGPAPATAGTDGDPGPSIMRTAPAAPVGGSGSAV